MPPLVLYYSARFQTNDKIRESARFSYPYSLHKGRTMRDLHFADAFGTD